ncbi:hypothetical protein AB1J28_14295 [Lysinibacillus irui]|uniref:hypothetical protein n=1 Tax=Lysinibacillus irui TaxID=2998077 RepID=UPI003D2DF93C
MDRKLKLKDRKEKVVDSQHKLKDKKEKVVAEVMDREEKVEDSAPGVIGKNRGSG